MGDRQCCAIFRLQGHFQGSVASGYQILGNNAKISMTPRLLDLGFKVRRLRIDFIKLAEQSDSAQPQSEIHNPQLPPNINSMKSSLDKY
jgi:hypothetical protein